MNSNSIYILFNSFTLSRTLRKILVLTPILLLLNTPVSQGAIPIAEIIRQAVKRVIVAVDLQVQRLQNHTIALQQAQQHLQNILSKTRLDEIAEWSEKQRELYDGYYQSLWKVKSVITQMKRVKEIADTQRKLVEGYAKSWQYIQKGGQFSAAELGLIQDRYGKILGQSIRNLEELTGLLRSMNSQQDDADRLERIHLLDTHMQDNYRDLMRISMQLETLSRQRVHAKGAFKTFKELTR